MSIEYCHYCDLHIDTDYDVEHFLEEDYPNRCVQRQMDEEEKANGTGC